MNKHEGLIAHLEWLAERLVHVYHEDPCADFVLATRRYAEELRARPERRFPVLLNYFERKQMPNCPLSVPWSLLAPHEEQALYNHDQTLKTEEAALPRLLELLAAHAAR